MTTPAIRGVVFGWDRTLVDTMDVILAASREATSEVIGEPFPITSGDIDLIVSMPAASSFSMLTDDRLTVEALLERHHEAYVRLAPSLIRPVLGAEEVLRHLRGLGIRTGVVTLKPMRRVAIDVEECGLEGLIDVFETGDGTGAATQPEPVRRGLAALGVPAAEALYVGERLDETIAARAAGIERIVLLDPTATANGDPRGTRALRSIAGLTELIGLEREWQLREGRRSTGSDVGRGG